MLADSVEAIRARLAESDLVLDVGGGARPFNRADWVLDLMPYADRGLYGPVPDPATERFEAGTWVVRDMCDREPWPFADGQFDFAVCSHTLEDVRDPVHVCAELTRVARAGYIEVPSRLEEQSYGFQGGWVGWSHHRWLVDVDQASGAISFVFKPHVIHGRARNHFDSDFRWSLSPADRVSTLWWVGGFDFGERILVDAPAVDTYLAEFVARHRPPRPSIPRRALARLHWALDTPQRLVRRRAD